MDIGRILGRTGIAVAALVVGATVLTLVRARGRRPPPPSGSGWHQVS